MRRAPLAALLPVVVLLTACSSFSDAEPYDDTLPRVELTALAGRELALDLRTESDVAIISGRLHDDLQRSLETAGVKVAAKAPLELRVRYTDITTTFRRGTWRSCGKLTAQLTRDGNPIARDFISDYCSDVLANPGDNLWARRASRGEIDAYERAYFGLLHAFFNDLEQTVATTLKG